MNLALATPAGRWRTRCGLPPGPVVVAYHDAGALALDAASQASLALAARLLADVGLPPPAAAP